MKTLLLTSALAFTLGFATPAHAETKHLDTYIFDAAHTNILLRVSHLGFSDMVLEALKPEGTLMFHPDHPGASSVDIVLKAAHIDGDDEKFNAHLQSADFFNVSEFPVVTFKSHNIEVTGEKTGVVTGDLTLLGVTKPVSLDVTFNQAGKNPFTQAETVGFTATKRSDFGMGYGLPGIGDEVKLDINFEAIKQQ